MRKDLIEDAEILEETFNPSSVDTDIHEVESSEVPNNKDRLLTYINIINQVGWIW